MQITFALLSAAVAVSASQHMHHQHGHQHFHEKRDAVVIDDVVNEGAVTEVVYVLNDVAIPYSEVEEGIANGTLILAPDGQVFVPSASSSSSTHTTTSTSTSTTSTTSSTPPPTTTSTTSTSTSTSTSTTSSPPPPPATSSAAAPVAAVAVTQSSNSNSGSNGVNTPFPDGQLDCSTFPSDYGAVAVPWLNIGGWTGIQSPGSTIGGFSNIVTAVSGGCIEGAYCSYACPAGYQKAQWPSTQGATGQSVGGILCQGGKLHLTNPSLANTLCIAGSNEVTVLIENNLSQNVAVCRTDYPGTESETVPLTAQPGTNTSLTTPDQSNYYFWQGKPTSAQYYVNPAGVATSDACQWGSPANPWGNYAPLNIGASWSPDENAASLALFPNLPTTTAMLGFSVTIKGDGLSGPCSYSNGQFCSNTGCSATGGCTITAAKGSTAVFVFSS